MSTIAEYHGRIKYQNETAFENVVSELKDHGWISDNNRWLVAPEVEGDLGANFDELTIHIPRSDYRDLGKSVDTLFDGATYGTLVGTKTDGEFVGWATTTEATYYMGLYDWAMIRGYAPAPTDDELSYSNWRESVIDDFHARFSYRTTLADFACDQLVSIDEQRLD